MTTAFQSSAFQNNAFQIETITPLPSGGGSYTFYAPAKAVDDDDEILAAWFMFMRQPYE